MGCNTSKKSVVPKPVPNQQSDATTVTEQTQTNSRTTGTNNLGAVIGKLKGNKRIIAELKYFNENAPDNFRLDPSFDGSNINEWIVEVDGAEGTIYQGEKFKVKFEFTAEYPSKAPTITFVPGHVPMHPHIYSNGHMCLQILYEAYQPEMTIVYILNGIMLMLDANKKKEWPYNDKWYITMGIKNPNHGMWGWEETY